MTTKKTKKPERRVRKMRVRLLSAAPDNLGYDQEATLIGARRHAGCQSGILIKLLVRTTREDELDLAWLADPKARAVARRLARSAR